MLIPEGLLSAAVALGGVLDNQFTIKFPSPLPSGFRHYGVTVIGCTNDTRGVMLDGGGTDNWVSVCSSTEDAWLVRRDGVERHPSIHVPLNLLSKKLDALSEEMGSFTLYSAWKHNREPMPSMAHFYSGGGFAHSGVYNLKGRPVARREFSKPTQEHREALARGLNMIREVVSALNPEAFPWSFLPELQGTIAGVRGLLADVSCTAPRRAQRQAASPHR